ncbi:MAG TPA: ThuA domain-containing protein [Thermoclostridium sp.]|nr:ThuA domain-containing protein [Thermoclostridium sp.]
MKKAILYGDYTNYLYHPLKGVDEQLKSIFTEHLDINSTEDLNVFNSNTLNKTDLLIFYKDVLNDTVKANHAAAVLSYVSNGGKLIILHNGISFFDGFEFFYMAGGKFDHHPEIRDLTFNAKGNHPITEGVGAFTIFEEPYRYEFTSHTPKNIFLEYEMDGQKYPAGWTVDYCLGKIVYLLPGHTADIFKNENYRQIILNSYKWLFDTEYN